MAAKIAKAWCVSQRQNIVGVLRKSLPAAQTVIVSRRRVSIEFSRHTIATAKPMHAKKILPI
jgi:hypothetical protein